MMLFLIRPSKISLVVCLFILNAPTALSAEYLTSSTVGFSTDKYDHQQVNISEPICRDKLRTLLLQQQIVFSDSRQPLEERRLAEESIDVARAVFTENQSYCDASMALTRFLENEELEKAQIPKTGQIQSLDTRR
ncbi:hypothetical protein LRP50_12755 [Enterovibrio sp. ZSDZ42]|uniref:Uncharacterized protein n=1 Tax=Enterovibrio gelatinilyticus TaxID=2899819 RepID=A0ABT5R162_9GAMM|nr:hypothetical protein [Enterovibrio sp. ZSDZ42]MDD1794004.1 hypothetical protein [Enterovibrio sp. ZSDZ42]